MDSFDFKKSVQALNFFAQKEGGEINKMKAVKLIWLSDRLHLRRYGRPLFIDKYYAMKNGPVQSATLDIANANRDSYDENELQFVCKYIEPQFTEVTRLPYFIRSTSSVDESQFSETDLEVMSEVYDYFSSYTPDELSELSHKYPEWKKFKDDLESGLGKRFQMDYLDFYEDPTSQDIETDFFMNRGNDEAKEIFLEQIR